MDIYYNANARLMAVNRDFVTFQAVGSKAGTPSEKVVIADCGEFV